MKVYQRLAQMIEQHQNLRNAEPSQFSLQASDVKQLIGEFERRYLPSGGGFDNGCEVDILESYVGNRNQKIIILTSFHHMKEGFYDGWTSHKVTVRPSFFGINIYVGGTNRNDIKSHVEDTMYESLIKEF